MKQRARPRLLVVATSAATIALPGKRGSRSSSGPVLGQGTWESTLQSRDLNGDGTADAFTTPS